MGRRFLRPICSFLPDRQGWFEREPTPFAQRTRIEGRLSQQKALALPMFLEYNARRGAGDRS
jgi:hypothetical protein